MPVRLGIIGLGQQVRNEFIGKYLVERCQDPTDVIVPWISGYLANDEQYIPKIREQVSPGCRFVPDEGWRELIAEGSVDAVLISLPNALHEPPLTLALQHGLHAAVDKPTTTDPRDTARLVLAAKNKQRVLMTMSQRRYEDVYLTVRQMLQDGRLGKPLLIEALMAQEYFGGRHASRWEYSRKLAGGGALIASGYHLVDTIFWLLKSAEPAVHPTGVSAGWVLDSNPSIDPDDQIETNASARIGLSNGGIFQVTSSFEGAAGALDENIKIYGANGTVRIMRDRFRRSDMQAALLSYQAKDGTVTQINTSQWVGLRWKPLEQFLAAVAAVQAGNPVPPVESSAEDSLPTIAAIDLAYQSARQGGIPLPLNLKEYYANV